LAADFWCLFGVELLETFKSFDLEKNDSVLAVILIAIIAVARRIVLFDLNGALMRLCWPALV
jgi:uncharacterized membrane protein (DUF373 family)